jgi:hypothetical protein
MIGNGGHQGGPVGEVPIGPWLTPQPPAPQPPQTGLLTLCFQHLERCRDQRFSKPNLRAHLAYPCLRCNRQRRCDRSYGQKLVTV